MICMTASLLWKPFVLPTNACPSTQKVCKMLCTALSCHCALRLQAQSNLSTNKFLNTKSRGSIGVCIQMHLIVFDRGICVSDLVSQAAQRVHT